MRRIRMIDLSGLCLLGVPLLYLAWSGPRVWRSLLPSRSDAALREAKRSWVQAQTRVDAGLKKFSAANPQVAAEVVDGWRREMLARDPAGDLSRAAAAARQATERARTLDERYQATLWLALIECDRGHHQAEGWLVRQLMAGRAREREAVGSAARRGRVLAWTCRQAGLLKP